MVRAVSEADTPQDNDRQLRKSARPAPLGRESPASNALSKPNQETIEYRIIYLTEAAEIIDTMYTETMSRRLGSISQANIRAIDPAYATVSYFLLECEERANAYTRVTLICVGLKLYTSLADLPL
jgi:hypothetical protein